ncbi:hypothetical protein NLI96_g13385 [Meripilus lineatus]|uniref:Uncharacterized protein n=1 Tax=Meripilus lineatus TaxID=2056292 RepID=A0AAD5USW2_9APHY|nr:hypothetical protein NLI96_g13385 [Physisporinus lineatus]
MLLHEHALHPEMRGDGRDLAGLVRLHAADRHERVGALRERVGDEVFELARLVAAERKAAVAVLALRIQLDLAAEVRAQALERLDRRRAERERITGETLQIHRQAPGGGGREFESVGHGRHAVSRWKNDRQDRAK